MLSEDYGRVEEKFVLNWVVGKVFWESSFLSWVRNGKNELSKEVDGVFLIEREFWVNLWRDKLVGWEDRFLGVEVVGEWGDDDVKRLE